MAIEYSLTIDSRLDPAQALEALTDALGAERVGESEPPFIQTRNIQITAIPTSGLGQEVIKENFGFRPRLTVIFRERRHDGVGPDAVERDQELVKGVLALLEIDPGDAVLLNNGENLVLQRIGGKLEVNTHWLPEDYPPSRLITVPHTVRLIEGPVL